MDVTGEAPGAAHLAWRAEPTRAELRSRVTVWDMATLTKVAAARTSVGVHFDWFLRDVYGAKTLPARSFTEGLLARGIISLGM